MARPTASDSGLTKSKILDKALVLFAEKGQKATFRDLSKETGLGLATIIHHYKNKENLYHQCISFTYERLFALREELIMLNIDSQNPHKLLKEIILKSLIFARKNQLIVKLFMRTIVDKGGLGEKNKEEFMFQLLEDSAEVMTGILNMKLEEARFLLVSLNHLIVRYSLHSEEDLRSTFKLKADQDLCPYLAEKMTNMVLNHSSL